MRFMPVKSAEQQATLMLHTTQELLIKQRTMIVSALRSHLSEFSIVVAKGIARVEDLRNMSEHDSNLPQAALGATRMLGKSLDELDNSLAELDKQIADAHAASDMSRLIIEVPGIGKLIQQQSSPT
jgi:transposase